MYFKNIAYFMPVLIFIYIISYPIFMTKIKFLEFYYSLDKKQAKSFKLFTGSAYFNKGRDFSGLIKAIDNQKRKYTNDKELVKTISISLKLKPRSIWNRLHELMSLADRYIAINELDKQPQLFTNLTLNYFLDGGSYSLFLKKINYGFKRSVNTKTGIDSNYYYYRFLHQLGSYYIFRNKHEEYRDNLTEQVIYHSASYIINHFLHLTELLQMSNLRAKDLASKGLNFLTDEATESFIDSLKEKYFDLHCLVSFHYNIYRAFLENDGRIFFDKAYSYFEKVQYRCDNSYRSMFYQIMINYCIERTNRGNADFYEVLFILYNRKLDEGLHDDLKVGNFPINNFRDYIFVALQLGKIDWIKNFIEKYSGLLPENVREDEVNLSYGILFYRETEYEKAISSLNLVAGDNYIHYMDSKHYKLRIYYETHDYENALMEIDNYKHYLRSHKEIPESFAKTYKVFLKEYTILLNSIIKNKKVEAEMLYKTLESLQLSPRRRWVRDKLKEVLKN